MIPGPAGSVRADFRADLAAHGVTSPRPVRVAWLLACRPGLLAQALLRAQQGLHRTRAGRPAAQLLRGLNSALTGADFSPGCQIGPGLRIEHPNGIVVGARVVVGRDAFICQRVTLGERLGPARPADYPEVGDGVFLGAGATVLGAVRIGAGARIGAGSVVLRDVPAGATAVGNPARVLTRAVATP